MSARFVAVKNVANVCDASCAEQILPIRLGNTRTELFDDVANTFLCGHFAALKIYQSIFGVSCNVHTPIKYND